MRKFSILFFSLTMIVMAGCVPTSLSPDDYSIQINETDSHVGCEIEEGEGITLSVQADLFNESESYEWKDSLGGVEGGKFSQPNSPITNYTISTLPEDKAVTVSVTVVQEDGIAIRKEITCNILAKDAGSEIAEVAAASPTALPTAAPAATPIPTQAIEPTAVVIPEKTETSSPADPITSIQQAIETFQERGYVIVGVRDNAPPFGMLKGGEYIGFDIDIAREMAQRWLGSRDAVKLVTVVTDPDHPEYDERLESVQKRAVDFTIAAITFTPDRCSVAACSLTYFQDGARLLVRADSGVTGPGDLNNRLVAVIEGTTAEKNIIILQQSYPYDIPPRLIYKSDRKSAIEAVRAGEVDAYSTDGKILDAFADSELIVVGGEFTDEPYTVVMNKNDTGLRQLINLTFQAMKEDGWYRSIYENHFACETPYLILSGNDDEKPEFVQNPSSPKPSNCEEQVTNQEVVWMVTSGQTLGGIAKDYYGDFNLYTCIQEASGLDNPNLLVSGMELILPPLDVCLDV